MDYGTQIIIVIAVFSLLIGFYQGWHVGMRQGILVGYKLRSIEISKQPTTPN
jgi:hypothetical protein